MLPILVEAKGGNKIHIQQSFTRSLYTVGGSPGLVVIGRDSCSEGRGFKSRHCKLDGNFFTFICCKNCNICSKINEKEAEVGPFLKKKLVHSSSRISRYEWPN